jgi:uncharacterized membrane protein
VKKWIAPVAFGILLGGIAHVAATIAIPRVIMSIALDRMEAAAGGTNKWRHNARSSAATQTIVRTSPDLAYSVCVLDLSKGSVRVSVEPWGNYISLALYDEATDNVMTVNDRTAPSGGPITMTVMPPGQTSGAPDAIALKSNRGLVLLRRLAPSQEAFDAAKAAQAKDVCTVAGS